MMSDLMLRPDFFRRTDVTEVARDLLGKVLFSRTDAGLTAGRIVETEAYAVFDKACHAYAGRRTARTEPMFGDGGTAYVYLCYGIHHLFNIATNVSGTGEAVLIRALEPVEGIDLMLLRRGMERVKYTLTAGPGALAQAMGIDRQLSGVPVFGPSLWLEDRGLKLRKQEVATGTRVGVAYAEEDAYLPYRFWIKENKWVSKGKGL